MFVENIIVIINVAKGGRKKINLLCVPYQPPSIKKSTFSDKM